MHRLCLAAALTALPALPTLAQNICTADTNGRFTSACVKAAQQQAYAQGVKATCEGLGGAYRLQNGTPRCTPPRRSQRPQINLGGILGGQSSSSR